MKTKWEAAKDEKEKTEVLVAENKRELDSLSSTVEADMRLADEYGRLSLSGSFSGPLEKAIRLLELHCHSLEEQGVSGDQLEKMRAGLEGMKGVGIGGSDASVQSIGYSEAVQPGSTLSGI